MFSDRISIWSPAVFIVLRIFKKQEWENGEWIKLALDEENWRAVVKTVLNPRGL